MSDTPPEITGDDERLPARQILNRYKIVDRTLDRWLADPHLGFPAPIIINKRRYFSLRQIEAWERGRVAARAGA